MDKPLLDGESSGGRRRGQTPVFHRRSDAIAYGSPYQKAAALVDLVGSCFSILGEVELRLALCRV
ncbi:hypothetical protein CK203_075644 [Vitis vinifera]|uniref:Uncharacterized protein n=1 Tax=Vitis vinifera TaxID=29760 RepID=A0A438EGK0_VITVI|nr:hypothetical protein CK203_075644 [Vitis vinifera]